MNLIIDNINLYSMRNEAFAILMEGKICSQCLLKDVLHN